jgi:hypothetical protein
MLEKFKKYFDYTMANIILAIIGITTIVAGLLWDLKRFPKKSDIQAFSI